MKKFVLFLIVIFLTINLEAITYKTLKLGEKCTVEGFSGYALDHGMNFLVTGNAIAVTYTFFSNQHWCQTEVTAVTPGISSFTFPTKNLCYVFNVVDVIPNKINIVVGEKYSFSPNIGSGVHLTWSSDNSSVATVTSNGVVTGISPGEACITCTDTNGTPFSCLVSVGTQLTNSITLNYHNYELNISDNVKLEATLLPNNATQKEMTWISGNDNIAQVDDEGNVTAISSGYCTIYAIAADGSGKCAKCLIHVLGETASSRADVNGDKQITAQDASLILQHVAKKIVLK